MAETIPLVDTPTKKKKKNKGGDNTWMYVAGGAALVFLYLKSRKSSSTPQSQPNASRVQVELPQSSPVTDNLATPQYVNSDTGPKPGAASTPFDLEGLGWTV